MVFYFKIHGYYYRFIDLKQNIRISNYIMTNLKFMNNNVFQSKY